LTAKYCPYGKVGDRITGRETWQKLQTWEENGCQFYDLADKSLHHFFEYKATNESRWEGKWKPSTQMPREASRILLEITDIRVEIFEQITEEDAIAEGTKFMSGYALTLPKRTQNWFWNYQGRPNWIHSHKDSFASLQNHLLGHDYWETSKDKWAWVVTFKRLK
jgi:hypothetical protein